MSELTTAQAVTELTKVMQRIANALDRAIPMAVDRSHLKQSDERDLTVVTPALRKKWDAQEKKDALLNPDSP